MLACLALLLASCGGLGARGPSPRCLDIQDAYRAYGAAALVATAITGSGALAAAQPDDRTPRFIFGLSAAVVAGIGVAAVYLRDDLVDEYQTTCTVTSTVASARDR